MRVYLLRESLGALWVDLTCFPSGMAGIHPQLTWLGVARAVAGDKRRNLFHIS